MKKTFLLLTLAGGFMLPAITHADTPNATDTKATKAADRHVVAARPVAAKQHVVYYITQEPRTGSNIPMVYRRYAGRLDSASAAAVYGQTDLHRTGTTDVGSELAMLDPSIRVSGRR